MAKVPPVKPLITIVGATGTGKSKLAVALAERYNGEIINADAIQLYRGFPIVTNKMHAKDMKGIRHHLLGLIGLDEKAWTVSHFAVEASKVINDVQARGKLPIVVGGTHYYIQSLLFDGHLLTQTKIYEEYAPPANHSFEILEQSTEDILKKLREVDPVMASRWHPYDRRRIRRSLEIWLQTGKKASDMYTEQRSGQVEYNVNDSGAQEDSVRGARKSRLRYETLLFWVHAEREALQNRLAARVNSMLDIGLLSEVRQLRELFASYVQAGVPLDESKGIWIAIGYKEFSSYLLAQENKESLSQLDALKADAIERIKIATRQYAKRQEQWIKIKLLPTFLAEKKEGPIFCLDGTDLNSWNLMVEDKASKITNDFLKGNHLPNPTAFSGAGSRILLQIQPSSSPPAQRTIHCDICNLTAMSDQQWQRHLHSKKHGKLTSYKNAPEYKAPPHSTHLK